MIVASQFPRLTSQNHRSTSPPTAGYNCIGWAANDVSNWWQPGLFWPFPSHPFDDTIAELKRVFQFLGYEVCADGFLEPGYEKIALFGIGDQYTHAARQISNGAWTSKLGTEDDIEHDAPHDVAGGVYGDVVAFMKRPISTSA
ncbi:MAG: hypothetical protein HYR84_06175 [Planctomycetes bacterium]|nr:hypothetical protein [Planctomycetota bacterium]